MASSCVDKRSQTIINREAINSGPITNSDGSYTLAAIDVFTADLTENILQQGETNPVAIAFNKYDNFYDVNEYLNTTFKSSYGAEGYPSLNNRWERGNITRIEFADFIQAFNYTPNQVLNQAPVKLLNDLDKYYAGDIFESILGGFCKSMQNLFNQIDSFYDLIGQVDAIITDAKNLYKKLSADYEGLPAFVQQAIIQKIIDEVEEKIFNVIEEAWAKLEDAINNFKPSEHIQDFVTAIDKEHTKYIMTVKESLCEDLSDEEKLKIKDKVKGFINYAVGLFDNLDLESAQFLVLRFCALASNIEALINEIKNPLDDYGNRYERIVRRLQTISNANTSTAIRNGAIRFSAEQRRNDINRLQGDWNGENGVKRLTPTGEEPIIVEPITADDYESLPSCGAVFKGSASEWKVQGKVFDEKEGIGRKAYTNVDLDVKVYLKRLQSIYGIQFIITNGWINKTYNENLEPPGPKDDIHMGGLVIDIKMDSVFKENPGSLDWTEVFTNNALKSGFKYIVIYDTHIHLDIREIPRWQLM